MQIWDTAGQEKFRNINTSYYKGANGILVVYDITNRESFEHLNSWLIEIEKNGNKNDLEDKRQISYNEGKEFASINGMQFFETSAKTAYKVQEAFITLTRDIIKTVSKEKPMDLNASIKLKKPGGSNNIPTNKKKCC